MEFIIVLPIYFLLLGFAFVAGELALHSIQLAGGADRSYALSSAAYEAFKKAASPDNDPDADEPSLSYAGDGGGDVTVSDYECERIEWHWDTGDELKKKAFDGPWSQVAAATVSDYYTLTPLTRGFVAFWYRDNKKKIENMADGVFDSGESVLDEMMEESGTIGRIKEEMTGRDRYEDDTRNFGYYTLQRTRQIETEEHKYYRSWKAGELVQKVKAEDDEEKAEDDKDVWEEKIFNEKFLVSDGEKSDLRKLSKSQPGAPLPKTSEWGSASMYALDGDLQKWKK